MIGQNGQENNGLNSLMVMNNFNQVKALCLVQLYCQLEHEKNDMHERRDGEGAE